MSAFTNEDLTQANLEPKLVDLLSMPAAVGVTEVVANLNYPLNSVYPQRSKISKGITCCLFDGTDKKIVHMLKDGLGVVESFNADNVATADSSNVGGVSNNRVANSKELNVAMVGILTPRSISSSVPIYRAGDSGFNTPYDTSIGRTADSSTSGPLRFINPTQNTPTLASVSFATRNVYDLGFDKTVNFWVEKGCAISFYCGSGETYTNDLLIDFNKTATNANGSPSYSLAGQTDARYVLIPNEFESGYVSIKNKTANKCYVMGVNIVPVTEADPDENYDAFVGWYNVNFAWWIGSSAGANDYAIRADGVGRKTAGSWHGGYSNEVLTLDNGKEVIAENAFVSGQFTYGRSLKMKSVSDLTDEVFTAISTQTVDFFQEGHRIESNVTFSSPVAIKDLYTGMTCTNNRFNLAFGGEFLDVSKTAVNSDNSIGKTASAIQYDPVSKQFIETQATFSDQKYTSYDGAFIKNRDTDYKFYFKGIDGTAKISSGFTAVTIHTFGSYDAETVDPKFKDLLDMPAAADVTANINLVNSLPSKDKLIAVNKLPVFAFCGDSITANGTISPNQWTDQGWVCWFRRMCADSAVFKISNNFAVASTDSDHLIATQLPLLLASDATHVIVMNGNNDAYGDVDTTANYQTFYDACTIANIAVIFIPVMPHSVPASFDAARTAQVSAMNKWLVDKSQIYPNLYYIDTLKTIMDFATGDAIAGFHRDGVHTTIAGARLLASAVYNGVKNILPSSVNITKTFNANSYSATYNPNGNLYQNPLMLGTSGIKSNGSTGTVISNLELRRKSSDTSSTVAGAVDSVEGYNNLNCQKITIGGTSEGNEQILIFNNIPAWPSSWVAGDTVEFECLIKLVNPVGIRGLMLRVTFDADGAYYDGKDYSFDAELENQNVFLTDMDWTKYKIRKTLVDNTTTISARIYVYTTSGVAMNAEVYVALPSLQKIS